MSTLSVLVVLIVIQSRIIGGTRRQNESLRAELRQLDELRNRSRMLSNALAQARADKPRQIEPSRELLRLRGQVGMLHRQLQEAQESQERSTLTEPSRQLSTLQNQIEIESQHLKFLTNQLTETMSAADRAQAILPIVQDPAMNGLLENLGMAEQKLRRLKHDGAATDGDVQDASNWIVELNEKIGKRCEGILAALQLRIQAMQHSAETFQAELAASKDVSK